MGLKEISQAATVEDYAIGEIIVKIDAPLRGLFLILEGCVTLSIFDNENGESDKVRIIETLYQGAIFGIQAILISGQVSDATVRAINDVELLVISNEKLKEIMHQFPYLSNMMGEMMEFNLRQRT